MARVPGKIHHVTPTGEVYLWLYTPQAADKLRLKIQHWNDEGGHAHSIESADITLLFKDGRPVMQPNPRRRKDAVLYKVTWKPSVIKVRNFYPSDYDSRFYNWLHHLLGAKISADLASTEELMDRSRWMPMIDNATHPTVVHPIPVDMVDDPDYDPDAHQSSRD